MQLTIDETNRRRQKQMQYNEEHDITPTQIKKAISGIHHGEKSGYLKDAYIEDLRVHNAAEDPIIQKMDRHQLESAINSSRQKMEAAAKELDFISAAQYRDEMVKLEILLERIG